MNATKTTLVEVMEFHGNRIAFEEINGKMMVNATQMAKPFGKTPKDWLRTQQANDLLQAMSARLKCLPTDLKVVRNGGANYGTFFQEDIALIFAQWLNPDFYIACNFKLKELLTQKAISLPAKYGIMPTVHNSEVLFPFKESCQKLGGVKFPRVGKRRQIHPQHFRTLFGRVFVTEHYLELLNGYYKYKKAYNQYKLAL